MHMADALISPEVGGVLWVVSATTAVYAARKIAKDKDSKIVPLMGVVGAFIFAAQMINFSIPLTGSSGHIGGGLLLAILIGPHAAFLTMFSILGVQALFFADGGLLALGCNIFNMAFISCYFVYPFIYKPLMERIPKMRFAVTVFAAVIGLQLGAFGVVVQTLVSGISALPFSKFVILMQPIHLAIGFVEGIATALVLEFVYKAAPGYFKANGVAVGKTIPKLVVAFAVMAVVCGGFISYLASSHPDGLEWSIGKTAGTQELEAGSSNIFATASDIQGKSAFLPDYSFSEGSTIGEKLGSLGTGFSGLVGAAIVILLAGGTGIFLIRGRRSEKP